MSTQKSVKKGLDKESFTDGIRVILRDREYKETLVIVEGPTDKKLFSKLITADIEVSNGVDLLIFAVSKLSKEKEFADRVIGIRDADFLHLDKKVGGTNIFLTDFHDAEMMILSCDKAYLGVAYEYLPLTPKDDNEYLPLTIKGDYLTLREKILKSIAFIGGLRWINDSDDLVLNFKKHPIGNYYKGKSLDEEACLKMIMQRSESKKRGVSKKEIMMKIENISDYFNLCNGHDFQRAFAIHITERTKKGVSEDTIARMFRIAYEFTSFQKTDLYQQLKNWSDARSKELFRQD
ncbi:MAG: hypothetical protein B6244_02940 [Candidatus Cloacimonetes bacterium 4572_55]|nr:MAG: hypothetical protein B6244_02940 [Candidatus Cloacimonetes bacterium 4572_55]